MFIYVETEKRQVFVINQYSSGIQLFWYIIRLGGVHVFYVVLYHTTLHSFLEWTVRLSRHLRKLP